MNEQLEELQELERSKANATIKQLKKTIRWNLIDKYFRLWMTRFDFEGLNRFQKRYLMKSFWQNGTCSCVKGKHLEGEEALIFTPYDPLAFNEYLEVSKASAINISGTTVIPKGIKTVNKDIVLLWCNSSRKGIYSLIQYYIERMIEVELLIRNNYFASSSPILATVTPEAKMKASKIIEKVFNCEPVLFQDVTDPGTLTALQTGAEFYADRLIQLKEYYNGIILGTIFGIDHKTYNAGDKKQFNTVDTDTSEEVVTNCFANDIESCIQEGINEINEAFGTNIVLNSTAEEARSIYEVAGEEEAIQPSKEGE